MTTEQYIDHKINTYETQVLLYWILGVLILNIGELHWVGWLSIVWGWMTALYTFVYAAKRRDMLKTLD